MALQFTHGRQVYVQAFLKESEWDTAETVEAASGYTLSEFEGGAIDYKEVRRDDISQGCEFGYDGYISRHDYGCSLMFPYLRPTDLGFLFGYALGTSAETAGTGTEYRHKNTLVSTGIVPTFAMVVKEAGLQKLITGCAISSLTVSRNGDYVQASCEIVGTRIADNSDDFPAEIAEEPLLYGNSSIWIESGADIDITATPDQGAENISAGTPDDLRADIVEGPTITINNNLRLDRAWDAANATDVMCKGQLHRGAKREITVEWTQNFESDAIYDYFIGASNVTSHVAFEWNLVETAQGVIGSGGAMYFGFIFMMPRGNLEPVGAASDNDGVLTRSYKLTAKTPTTAADSETNPVLAYVYTAQAGYAS